MEVLCPLLCCEFGIGRDHLSMIPRTRWLQTKKRLRITSARANVTAFSQLAEGDATRSETRWNGNEMHWPVMGAYEVKDQKITAWREYFTPVGTS